MHFEDSEQQDHAGRGRRGMRGHHHHAMGKAMKIMAMRMQGRFGDQGGHAEDVRRGMGRGGPGGFGEWGGGGPRGGMGGGGRGGWGDGREGGGSRRRMFDSGELRLVLLSLIADQPRHGYDLIRAIEERTGGAYAPSPGVVYPTITLLQDMGHIEEQASAGSRRLYAATDEGRALLAEKATEIEALFARLEAVGAARERVDGGAIRRAVHNLKAVLHNRLAGADVDEAQLHEVVAIIDEAAQRIERL